MSNTLNIIFRINRRGRLFGCQLFVLRLESLSHFLYLSCLLLQ